MLLEYLRVFKVSWETAADNVEEGGDDVKSSWPLCPGPHTCYNGAYRGKQDSNVEPTPKARPSSDRGLQLALVKVESLVIADQQAAVNTFPGLVHTARHTTKAYCNRNGLSEAMKLWSVIGVKS